jgi:starvation-inducible DNA-binding protein
VTLTDTPTIATALDAPLHELINLGLLAKQAHWNVHGPAFRSLHLLLDELADLARRSGDELAERAVTLRHSPDGRASIVAATTSSDLPPGPITDVQAIEAFDRILSSVGDCLRCAIDSCGDDPVTQDLLTGIAGEVEKQAWMIRAHR